MFWRRRKDKFSQFRAVALPGEVGSVSLPAHFAAVLEDDSTLMAYPPGKDTITLRFSSISFSTKGSDENPGKAFVQEKAAREGLSCTETADRSVLSSDEEESEQDGVPILVRFWEVGMGTTILIISATVIEKRSRHRTVRQTLGAMPARLGSLQVTTSHRLIESDGREVRAVARTADPVPQSVRAFDRDEQDWLASNLDHAAALGLAYGSGGRLTPEELDRVFSRWMAEAGEKEPGHLVANALGAAFGAYLVEHHGFRWVLVTDEYGSEYAVRHPFRETTSFPRASVEKRIAEGQPEFFQDVCLIILDQLKRSEEQERQAD